jgi:hypothetical protein
VVLVTPASRQDSRLRELVEEAADRRRALQGLVQVIQAEFQESFARLGFAPGMGDKGWNVWQAQRDADAR